MGSGIAVGSMVGAWVGPGVGWACGIQADMANIATIMIESTFAIFIFFSLVFV
jgi:hypothetical protein